MIRLNSIISIQQSRAEFEIMSVLKSLKTAELIEKLFKNSVEEDWKNTIVHV